MSKRKKDDRTLIWVVVGAIVVLLAIILIISLTSNPSVEEDSNLPDVSEADYASLESSSSDFSALEEAVDLLG